MNTFRLALWVFAVFAGQLFAADDTLDKKPIRRSWFPRFSPDSKWLVTAHGGWEQGEGGEVRVWDARTGKEKFVIDNDRGVRTVCWSPNGDFFAAGDYGNTVRLYDAKTGKKTDEIKYSGTVEVLLITPDAKRVITCHGGGSVRVTELSSKKRVRTWSQIHDGGIWGAALSPDGNILATAGRDGFVRIIHIGNSLVVHELKHPASTNGLAFTRDGRYLATGCQDSIIRIFDVAEGTEVRQIEGHDEGSVTDLQFSSDGKLLATCGMDQTVRLWDMTDFEKPTMKSTLDGHKDFVFGIAISADGKMLASAGWDSRINVWAVDSGDLLWTWPR